MASRKKNSAKKNSAKKNSTRKNSAKKQTEPKQTASKKRKVRPKQIASKKAAGRKPRTRTKGAPAKDGNTTVQALLDVLQRRKQASPENYAAALGDLLEEAGQPRSSAGTITKTKDLRERLTITAPTSARGAKAEGALVGFVEDVRSIVANPALLVALLQGARMPSKQLVSMPQLVRKLYNKDHAAFAVYWNEATKTGRLPAGVGALRHNGLQFFLWSDVVPSIASKTTAEVRPPVRDESPGPATPVRDRLLEAFDELDVRGGRRNYVTLFDLRSRLPDVGRDGFDAALNELRREWILTLDPAEGRHERLPEEVLAAGIMDQSSLLVYAARRDA